MLAAMFCFREGAKLLQDSVIKFSGMISSCIRTTIATQRNNGESETVDGLIFLLNKYFLLCSS